MPSSNPLQMVFNRNFIESCNQWSTLLPSNRNIRIVSCKVVYHFHSFNAAFRMNQPNKSKHTVIDGCLPKIYYHFGYIFKQSVWICLHSHQEPERERTDDAKRVEQKLHRRPSKTKARSTFYQWYFIVVSVWIITFRSFVEWVRKRASKRIVYKLYCANKHKSCALFIPKYGLLRLCDCGCRRQ